MASIAFDIATNIISAEQSIWSVFPGFARRYLEQFLEREMIFLETPAMRLTRAALSDDALLQRHVAMSEAWKEYYDDERPNPPSRNPQSYDPPKTRPFAAMVGNVRNIFVRMRPGDLVVVGQYSLYEPVYFGEIVGDFDPDIVAHDPRYGRESIPARRVRWLSARIERRYLSQPLSLLLSNRKAVINIEKGEFGDEVYGLAYGDYVFGSDARYVFRGPKYNNIATATVPGINLITYFASAFNACELNEIDRFSTLTIQRAIDSYFQQDILYSFEIDFSSPGEYILHAKRAVLPLLVATLVAATAGDTPFDDARGAEIRNSAVTAQSATDSDTCLEIQEKYRAIMTAINADRYRELCELNRQAQDGVGLNVRVKRRMRRHG